MPPVDIAVLTSESGPEFAAHLQEGLRTGIDGWLDDDLAFARAWGFEPAEVSVPTFIWQGTEDRAVPLEHARWLADQIPGAVLHLVDGEGHLSIATNAIDRMFQELVTALA
jgi:pimeloyl-ACP methyl ester carboxylesterase